MKKRLFIFIILLFTFIYTGCSTTTNEIYNRSYDVDIKIDDINKVLIPAVEKASDSVIGISLYERKSYVSEYSLVSTGTGVVYKGYAVLNNGSSVELEATKDSSDVKKYVYYAITNNHVIAGSTANKRIKVFVGEEKIYENAIVLGNDVTEDLAILRFETSIYITPIEFDDSDSLKKGEFVIAIGNSEGYEYFSSVSFGIVSYPKRFVSVKRGYSSISEKEEFCEFIQHDASINSGNSGGPLVNTAGKLVGINTIKLYSDNETIEGMGFAIPSNIVKNYIPYLENGFSYQSLDINKNDIELFSVNELRHSDINNVPTIEINLDNVKYGLFVNNITKSVYSKINLLKLRKNDIILEINDQKLIESYMFKPILRSISKNDEFTIKILRDGEEIFMNLKY